MIVFDLACLGGGHRFEGWFASSQEFERQQRDGLLCCPQCGAADVAKAPMAPNVSRKGNQIAAARPEPAGPPVAAPSAPVASTPMPPEAAKLMHALARMQAEALKSSRWVGKSFAEDARAMHYGERDVEAIHGEATPDEARDLIEEGIEVAPLPFPVAPPGKSN